MAAVPRWEWRTFGPSFPDVERRVFLEPHDLKVGLDTYVLSRRSDASVTIRNEQLDVKLLERVEGGLELWRPVLKAPFPVEVATITSVFRSWAIDAPRLEPHPRTLRQFLTDIVRPVADLRAIDVTKERRSISLDGCTLELASLSLSGSAIQTVAVQSTAPERVRRTVGALGFALGENVNCVVALKQLLGMPQARSAQEGALS